MADAEVDPALMPAAGVSYPIKVEYCPRCSMPFEYCQYYPGYEECKRWLEDNMPDRFEKLGLKAAAAGGEDGGKADAKAKAEGGDDGGDDGGKKRQTRGGKGMVKAKKKDKEVEKRVCLSIAPRGKRKAVTVVQGLKTCGVDLKVASKFFGQKFACGASITGDDEIVIQGDFKDDLFDLIPEKWPDLVDEDVIEDLGEKKRTT